MSPRYLLDANALSDIIRNPRGRVAMRAREVWSSTCTSIVAAAELRYGVMKGGSDQVKSRVEDLLDSLMVLPFESPADRRYGELRADLEKRGRPISANDMLIAAHALAEDCVVVTDSVREFERVPDLKIENWQR